MTIDADLIAKLAIELAAAEATAATIPELRKRLEDAIGGPRAVAKPKTITASGRSPVQQEVLKALLTGQVPYRTLAADIPRPAVASALLRMRNAGLVVNPSRGLWAITDAGRALVDPGGEP